MSLEQVDMTHVCPRLLLMRSGHSKAVDYSFNVATCVGGTGAGRCGESGIWLGFSDIESGCALHGVSVCNAS